MALIEQHTRRVRAGQPPAACGFGTGCTGSKACADHDCENHPVNTELLGLPVIDTKFLDEQIQHRELHIEMIEPERQPWKRAALFVGVVLAVLSAFLFSTM